MKSTITKCIRKIFAEMKHFFFFLSIKLDNELFDPEHRILLVDKQTNYFCVIILCSFVVFSNSLFSCHHRIVIMFEFVFNPIQIAFQFICYLILDNIVKYFVTRNKSVHKNSVKIFKSYFIFYRKEHRFDILLFECFILGFLISYLCLYHFIPYVLLFFFTIHLIGTIYSSKDDTQQKSLLNLVQANHSKVKTISKEYLYNFHLKPTNDFRLQQVCRINRD